LLDVGAHPRWCIELGIEVVEVGLRDRSGDEADRREVEAGRQDDAPVRDLDLAVDRVLGLADLLLAADPARVPPADAPLALAVLRLVGAAGFPPAAEPAPDSSGTVRK
jgi:hypothetical protein